MMCGLISRPTCSEIPRRLLVSCRSPIFPITIKQIARNDGMISLREDGVRKVLAGVTTLEEVLRVTHEDAG